MKKILKRISPIVIAVFILAISAITIIISALVFNQPVAEVNHTPEYTELQNKIQNWNEPRQEQMSTAFIEFYEQYKMLNASTYNDDDLVSKYDNTREAFQKFYADYYQRFIYDENISDYLLVRTNYIDKLNDIMDRLDKFLTGPKDKAQILNGLSINAQWEDATLQEILNNIFVQKISDENLTTLQEFLQNTPPSNAAYNYARHTYLLAVAQDSAYEGQLSTYDGFADYQDEFTSRGIIQLAQYQLQNPDQTYADAFAFGKIHNNTPQVSICDFIFTNLEMATLPILILIIILSACAFFTDIYQNTIITTLSACRRRSAVIIAKLIAILLLSITTLLAFTLIYTVIGILFFNAQLTADILFLFNGTQAVVMSPINYLVLYLFNLLVKILPFIAITGLFSFAKTDPRVIVMATLATSIVIIICNALLGHFWFYQFAPLLALDPIRYFGASLFISPTPPIFNILYTLPVMSLIIVYLYWQLIHNFRKKDF